jgi:hypothetical protein
LAEGFSNMDMDEIGHAMEHFQADFQTHNAFMPPLDFRQGFGSLLTEIDQISLRPDILEWCNDAINFEVYFKEIEWTSLEVYCVGQHMERTNYYYFDLPVIKFTTIADFIMFKLRWLGDVER